MHPEGSFHKQFPCFETGKEFFGSKALGAPCSEKDAGNGLHLYSFQVAQRQYKVDIAACCEVLGNEVFPAYSGKDLFGFGLYQARLVSFLSGLLLIWFIYLLGKKLYDRKRRANDPAIRDTAVN